MLGIRWCARLAVVVQAFIVEAAVSIGGSTLAVGINCCRFANRIPLMYEQASDVVYKTAQAIKWKAYKIDPTHDKIGVYVSIVSTKIPFKVWLPLFLFSLFFTVHGLRKKTDGRPP